MNDPTLLAKYKLCLDIIAGYEAWFWVYAASFMCVGAVLNMIVNTVVDAISAVKRGKP